MKQLSILSILCAVTLSCGVKKEVHQSTLDSLAKTELELKEAQSENSLLKGENQTLSGELGQTEEEKAAAAARAEKLALEMKATEKELLELRKQRAAADKRLQAFKELTAKFKSLVDTGKLNVVFKQGQMVLELPSGVLFGSGTADLSKSGQIALAEILHVLRDFSERRFMVAGHTDNDPIRSRKFKNNWSLSTARAVSVVDYMISSGFPTDKLAAAGYGEFAPVAANDTPENKQKNRRIEIILVPDLSELPGLNDVP